MLAHHGIERFHLLCHDYGDTVGQELLARHRDGRLPGLQSIAFLNGGLFPETHRPRPIQRVLASPVGSLVARFTNERTFARAMRRIFASTSQPSADELETLYALSSRDDVNLALAAPDHLRGQSVGAIVNAGYRR